MTLTKEEIQDIEREAEEKYPDFPQVRISTLGVIRSYHEAKRQGYITAATAYAERAKGLVEWVEVKITYFKSIQLTPYGQGKLEAFEEMLNKYKNYTNDK